jgi:hypothetical protein
MIKRFLRSVFIMVGIMGLVSIAAPLPVYAAECQGGRLLTLPAWYKGLNCKDNTIVTPTTEKETQKYLTQIVLNVIDILIQIAGYAAIVFIIIGGFRYLTSAGSPNAMTAARKTILNAIIGLLIAIFAVTIVNLVGAIL